MKLVICEFVKVSPEEYHMIDNFAEMVNTINKTAKTDYLKQLTDILKDILDKLFDNISIVDGEEKV